MLSVRDIRHHSLRVEHSFVGWVVEVGWCGVPLYTLYCVAFLGGICHTAQESIRMVRQKCFVVHVKLLDSLSSDSCQHLNSRDVEACHIILAELHIRVHDSPQIVLLRHLEQDEFSLSQGRLDVELTDLRDLGDQVGDFYVVVDFEHYVHRLVIVDVVVTLCKLL